jgi:SRSO17 transposase
LYFSSSSGTVRRGGRPHGHGAHPATGPLAGAVHELLWHRAQLLSLRTYVQGVFSDSERKSMQAMLARVTEPVACQAFQHFIMHAPWDADRVWCRLRAVIPERRGVLILDGTSFPKQGPASVGAARQYCGALGKIADCQVATTVALDGRARGSSARHTICPTRG